MLFNIVQIHAGMISALFVFLIWSFPEPVNTRSALPECRYVGKKDIL